MVIEFSDRLGGPPAGPGTESTSKVCSALTSTLRGKARARSTTERAGSRRRTRTFDWRRLSSGTSVVNNLVASMTALLSAVCHDATSKLMIIGARFESHTARATGCVLSARIAYDTMRQKPRIPIRYHTTVRLLVSSQADRTPP